MLKTGNLSRLALAMTVAAFAACAQDQAADLEAQGGTPRKGSPGAADRDGDGIPDAIDPDPAVPKTPKVFAPGPRVVPRLTAEQYWQSVRVITGKDVPRLDIEADTSPQLFETIGAAGAVYSERGVSQLESAADRTAENVFGDAAARNRLIGCAPTAPDDACIRAYVAHTGRLAFRRKLDDDEMNRYVKLSADSAAGDSFRGARAVLSAMLQSPNFVYRVELGSADPDKAGQVKFTGYDMASRLAFKLWNAAPDDALLDAAERGELDTVAGLKPHVARMADDERAKAAVASFFRQYLSLEELDHINRDEELYPFIKTAPEIGSSLRGEIERVTQAIAMSPDADYRTLFDTKETFVDANVARLYGLPPPAGDGFQKATLPDQRAGILSMGGIAAVNARRTSTSPTRRGLFVRQRFLCETIPNPPPGAPQDLDALADPAKPQTVRELLDGLKAKPQCDSCHRFMDGIGLGMDDLDAVGGFRTRDGDRAVDASGRILAMDGLSEPIPFAGSKALGAILRNDPRIATCVARQTLRHGLGRIETKGEEASVDSLVEQFAASGYRFRTLLSELVVSDAFRFANAPEENQ